ncbi:MAG: flagellar basal body rod protein FlgB [Epsilonproteobacteria bacterium]|jgi:flagellar basal-body rod protein FlgB|nr:flagellar basal body rod protein FlgB [Campylobacterota bacterium]
MGFEISKSFDIMEKSLGYRRIRQDMISSNLANADTPFYKSKDIRFEEALEAEIDKKFHKPTKKLELAKTNSAHLDPKDFDDPQKPILFYRDGHLERNDGNTVDVDVETTEMAKNAMAYNATVAALRKDIEIFKAVIDSSKNI